MTSQALCEQYGIDFPLFAFSHCRDVVAAVTNAGGLGVLGALAFSPEQLELELKWIDENVDGKNYGVDTVMPMSYAGKEDGLGKQDAKTGEVDASVFQDMIPAETKAWIERVLEEYEVLETIDWGKEVDVYDMESVTLEVQLLEPKIHVYTTREGSEVRFKVDYQGL